MIEVKDTTIRGHLNGFGSKNMLLPWIHYNLSSNHELGLSGGVILVDYK